jgi:hypothetical protein
MHAAQDKDQQLGFLKRVTKFPVPQNWRISSVAEKTSGLLEADFSVK